MSKILSALDITPISQSGNEIFPFSGAGDPGNTLAALQAWVFKATWVKVEYGSASNQASVIQAAIDAATAGDALYFGTGVVKIETNVSTTKKLFFRGNGGTIFRTTSNITILTFTTGSSDSEISGIQFEGNDTGAAQIGMLANAITGFQVVGCVFKDLNIYGLQMSTATSNPYRPSRVDRCVAISCPGSGYLIAGEYIQVIGSYAGSCGKGFEITGGNMNMSICNATGNTGDGLYYNTTSNGGHSQIHGFIANHNGGFGININSVDSGAGNNGLHLIGAECFSNAFKINDNLVFVTGLETDGVITVSNCSRALFTGCRIHGNPPGAPSGTSTANIVWVNCYDDAGNLYAG